MAKLESLQDQIAEEVFDTVAKLDRTNSTLSLLQEDMIPKSQRALELAIDDYSDGKSDYAQLISNWRSLLRYRIAPDPFAIGATAALGSPDSPNRAFEPGSAK